LQLKSVLILSKTYIAVGDTWPPNASSAWASNAPI